MDCRCSAEARELVRSGLDDLARQVRDNHRAGVAHVGVAEGPEWEAAYELAEHYRRGGYASRRTGRR